MELTETFALTSKSPAETAAPTVARRVTLLAALASANSSPEPRVAVRPELPGLTVLETPRWTVPFASTSEPLSPHNYSATYMQDRVMCPKGSLLSAEKLLRAAATMSSNIESPVHDPQTKKHRPGT